MAWSSLLKWLECIFNNQQEKRNFSLSEERINSIVFSSAIRLTMGLGKESADEAWDQCSWQLHVVSRDRKEFSTSNYWNVFYGDSVLPPSKHFFLFFICHSYVRTNRPSSPFPYCHFGLEFHPREHGSTSLIRTRKYYLPDDIWQRRIASGPYQ